VNATRRKVAGATTRTGDRETGPAGIKPDIRVEDEARQEFADALR
jgi:hypothetical protein